MKFFAVALLLTVCIVENATADWRSDVRANHMQQINTIVDRNLNSIRTDANIAKAKGKQNALACYETARGRLQTISNNGYIQVSNCVRTASTAGVANVCCQQVDSSVFNQGQTVTREANACISKA